MQRLLRMEPRRAALLYGAVDGLCLGMGMGVPFFNIALGFPLGVYLALRLSGGETCTPATLRRILGLAVSAALITTAYLVIVWAPWLRLLFDPNADFGRVGIPMILYEPRASFIAWQALMMIVSPFLQLLASVFAATVVLSRRSERP